jgi:chemotaxis protein CheD
MTSRKPLIHLHPGEHSASSERTAVISTILGSCVSACLYDPVQHLFGMNHFLLSSARYSRNLPYYETDAGRYGIQAMELLINQMLSLGARRQNLKAKAFGGASILPRLSAADNYLCVGEVNVRFIREFLAQEEIPLVSEDLGGKLGRVIRFHGSDFSVYVKKIRPLRSKEICTQEQTFWKASLAQQKEDKPDVTIWE